MRTYRATVRVPHPSGHGSMTVWATVAAANPVAAKAMLEAQYGRGNVAGAPIPTGS